MNWPDLADELPAPRDDEPSSLRQDIADELADHLHSSLVRELHRTPEETSAKQHVLDRFGDPRRVARQLWFDAMKEKIMSQRLMLTALVVTAVACLGSTGLSWMLVQQSREANQALLEQAKEARVLNRELLTQNEAANSKMLDTLALLAKPATAAPVKSMEWNSVKVRLVKDQSGGTRAVGYEVRLRGHLLDSAKVIEIVRKTDTEGMADFGLMRPGQHELNVGTSWNESRLSSNLTVLPGQELVEEVICPGSEREEVAVSVSFDWPQELRNKGLWLICGFYQGMREVGGNRWGVANPRVIVIFNAENQVISPPIDTKVWPSNPFAFADRPAENEFGLKSDETKLLPWDVQRIQQGGFAKPASSKPGEPISAHALRPFHYCLPDSETRGELRLPAGQYTLNSLLVAEHPALEAENGVLAVDVLGGVMDYYNPNSLSSYRGGEFVPPFSDWIDKETEHEYQIGSAAYTMVSRKAQPKFAVVPGEPNRIKLPLHPRLVANVRDFLEFTK